MATGMQRDGIKAAEVFTIVRLFKLYREEGEEIDTAYSLACRGDEKNPMAGVAPEVFKRWKSDIIDHVAGKPTGLDSLLSGSVDPATSQKGADPAMMRRLDQLGTERDALKGDHKRAMTELEEMRARLDAAERERDALKAAALGEDPKKKDTTPAKK